MNEAAAKLTTEEVKSDESNKVVITTVEDSADRTTAEEPADSSATSAAPPQSDAARPKPVARKQRARTDDRGDGAPSDVAGPDVAQSDVAQSDTAPVDVGQSAESDAAPSDEVSVEIEDSTGKTSPRADYAKEALKFVRKGADTLKKGADEARKGANRLIEKSRNVSIQKPNWATVPVIRPKFVPRADFSMGADSYEIAIELPGLEEKDVHVKLSNGQITVSGEKRNGGADETGRSYFFQERHFGRFERSFRRPNDADPSKIEARFERNVLKIRLPKFAEAVGPEREIEVKAG